MKPDGAIIQPRCGAEVAKTMCCTTYRQPMSFVVYKMIHPQEIDADSSVVGMVWSEQGCYGMEVDWTMGSTKYILEDERSEFWRKSAEQWILVLGVTIRGCRRPACDELLAFYADGYSAPWEGLWLEACPQFCCRNSDWKTDIEQYSNAFLDEDQYIITSRDATCSIRVVSSFRLQTQ
jgi:hypothetical protein